jgi:hypothetical protein
MNASRLFPYLIGPELYWTTLILVIYLLCRQNLPPTEQGNNFLASLFFPVALVGVPLAFACFLVNGPGRWLLLLRVNLTTVVGLIWIASLLGGAVDYRDSRNSGVGSGVLITIILGVFFLGVLSAVTAIVLWWQGRSTAS